MNAMTDKVRVGGASQISFPARHKLFNPIKSDVILKENLSLSLCVFQSVFGDGENTKVLVAELEEEVQTLKKINKDLYDFSSQLLTKPT